MVNLLKLSNNHSQNTKRNFSLHIQLPKITFTKKKSRNLSVTTTNEKINNDAYQGKIRQTGLTIM